MRPNPVHETLVLTMLSAVCMAAMYCVPSATQSYASHCCRQRTADNTGAMVPAAADEGAAVAAHLSSEHACCQR